MAPAPVHSVTVIFSPYHVGIHNDAVGAGPTRLREQGLLAAVRKLGVVVNEFEIKPVDEVAEGDIGRSFEVFRRTAKLVTAARDAGSFPIVVAGNCSAEVGVLGGIRGSKELGASEVGCVWFDAHDDFNVPDTVLSGYFDSMPVAIMAGQCWKALLQTIPGYKPLDLARFVHCGLRDVNDMERKRVLDAGYPVIWGRTDKHVDFGAELRKVLDSRAVGPALVHVDLDSLDSTVGQASGFPPAPGGLSENDLIECLKILAVQAEPVSLTVASFDPAYDADDKITGVAIRAVVSFVSSLLEGGILKAERTAT